MPRSFGKVRQAIQVVVELSSPALDEAMEDSDQAALGRLYRLVVDCHIFASFVDALRDHIKVSRQTSEASN